jgi:hypothetical protein
MILQKRFPWISLHNRFDLVVSDYCVRIAMRSSTITATISEVDQLGKPKA